MRFILRRRVNRQRMKDRLATIQALLFVAGEEGLTLEQLSSLLEIDKAPTRQWVEELQSSLLENEHSGLEIIYTAQTYRLVTKAKYETWIKKFAISPFSSQISPAAMETLAIIAYKQPITRLDIEGIRGVQSSGALQKLLMRNLIEEAGRLDAPGRPKLYKTTKYFMDYFKLDTLESLPDVSELMKKEKQIDKLF